MWEGGGVWGCVGGRCVGGRGVVFIAHASSHSVTLVDPHSAAIALSNVKCSVWWQIGGAHTQTFSETFLPKVTSPETVRWSSSSMSGMSSKRLRNSRT